MTERTTFGAELRRAREARKLSPRGHRRADEGERDAVRGTRTRRSLAVARRASSAGDSFEATRWRWVSTPKRPCRDSRSCSPTRRMNPNRRRPRPARNRSSRPPPGRARAGTRAPSKRNPGSGWRSTQARSARTAGIPRIREAPPLGLARHFDRPDARRAGGPCRRRAQWFWPVAVVRGHGRPPCLLHGARHDSRRVVDEAARAQAAGRVGAD